MFEGITDRIWLRYRDEKVKLAELAFFIEQVSQMNIFISVCWKSTCRFFK
jgi:hypothetical protein